MKIIPEPRKKLPNLTSTQRSAVAVRRQAARTPEQRSATARKSWVTRRRNMGLIAALLAILLTHNAFAQCAAVNNAPNFTLGGNAFGMTGPQWKAYLASKVDANNGTLCGPTITNVPNPINAGDAASKQYVDNKATPIVLHAAVNLATNGSAAFTGAISGTALTVSNVASATPIGPDQFITGTGVAVGTYIVSGSGTSWVVSQSQTVGSEAMTSSGALPINTYSNGTAGVGATLTGQVNGALYVDGTAVVAGMRIGVKDELSPTKNGIYVDVRPGDTGTTYQLVRASDFNSSVNMTPNSYFLVQGGQVNISNGWLMTTQGIITPGVSPINWIQFTAATPGLGFTPLNPVSNLSDVANSVLSLNNLAPVPHNLALKALTGMVAGNVIQRKGFAVAGDGGDAFFTFSTTNCSIGGGSGDNGSQVGPTSGGGCWNIMRNSAGEDVLVFGAQCGASDSTPYLQAALNAQSGRGAVLISCPITINNSGSSNTIVSLPSGTKLYGNGSIFFAGMSDTPGPSTYPTSGPAIACTNTAVAMCLGLGTNAIGVDVRGINFYQPQPNPPASGTWTPLVYGYVIGSVANSGWQGLTIKDVSCTSCSHFIDVEGTPNYTAFTANQIDIERIWCNACLENPAVELHLIDNYFYASNWNFIPQYYGSTPSMGAYQRTHAVSIDMKYVAAPTFNAMSFFAGVKSAITAENDTVTNNFGTLTFAVSAAQFENTQFNQVCQAITLPNGNGTIVGFEMVNTHFWGDQSGFQCSKGKPLIDLPSNAARLSLSEPYVEQVDTFVRIGCGAPGVGSCPSGGPGGGGFLSIDNLGLMGPVGDSSYSTWTTGSHFIQAPTGTNMTLSGFNMANVVGAPGAGSIIGPGLDGSMTPTTVFIKNYNGFPLASFDWNGANNLTNFSGIPNAPHSGAGLGYVCIDSNGTLYYKNICP